MLFRANISIFGRGQDNCVKTDENSFKCRMVRKWEHSYQKCPFRVSNIELHHYTGT